MRGIVAVYFTANLQFFVERAKSLTHVFFKMCAFFVLNYLFPRIKVGEKCACFKKLNLSLFYNSRKFVILRCGKLACFVHVPYIYRCKP